MPLGTALRKECKQRAKNCSEKVNYFFHSLIYFLIFTLELCGIEYNRHISPLQKVDELELVEIKC